MYRFKLAYLASQKKFLGRRRIFASCLFLFLTAASLEAQYFKPFTALKVIKTAHFDIIYPEESAQTAEALTGFADALYNRVTSLLNIYHPSRIPVVITPHTDQLNGLTMSLPYTGIILFDTVMEPERTSYRNNLEGLFLHELTHAISLSSRSEPLNVLRRIFGGWVYPVALNAPLFMVEGVTVSFESLDGSGRANDPLVRESLIQAVHENKFLTPFQSSGVYDLPPLSNAYYYYGGLFSAWLQQKYGMEKYARLWESMGRDFRFSFWFYKTGIYYFFEQIYERPFLDAWNEFKESFRLNTIEENSTGTVYNGPFYRKKVLISGLSSGGGKIFFLDQVERKVLSYDPKTQKIQTVLSADPYVYHLEASPDGATLLLSSYRHNGNLVHTVVTEYDTRRGWKTGRAWDGLYEGRYFRDGVLGIGSDRYINNIVYRPNRGRAEEVLLRGSAELVYINPVAVDDTWIAFIAAKRGKRELCLYNYDTKTVFTLKTELEDDEERLKYIRNLGVSEGNILFAYNHDRGMYKLGSIALPPDFSRGSVALSAQTGSFSLPAEVTFSEQDFSGGVFMPAMADGTVYYRGAFTTWNALMRFPEPAAPEKRAALTLVPWPQDLWNEAALGTTNAALDTTNAALDTTNAALSTTNAATDAAGNTDRRNAENSATESLFATGNYHALPYLNPLKYWIPYPLIRINQAALENENASLADSISLDGAGIYTLMTDPARINLVGITAGFDARSLMGVFNIQWINTWFGLPLNFTFQDDVDKSGSIWSIPVRTTRLGLSTALTRGIGGELVQFSLFPSFATNLTAPDTGNGLSPYTWDYGDPRFVFSLGLGLSSLTRLSWEVFGSGLALTVYGRYVTPSVNPFTYRFEGALQAAFEPVLPLQFRLYGIWDENKMNLAGFSRLYTTSTVSDLTPVEYSTSAYSLKWLTGGEAEVKLFSLEIQRNLSHIYYNRLFSTLAYRGGLYDYGGKENAAAGQLLWNDYRLTQSLILRLGLTFSFAVIPAFPGSLTLYTSGILKISNMFDDNPANDYAIGIYFSGLVW
jgi:hypothetical protein